MAPIDAVLEFWFSRPDEIAGFFAEREYLLTAGRFERDCIDVSNVRALVTKMRVIHDEFSFQPSTVQPLGFSWD